MSFQKISNTINNFTYLLTTTTIIKNKNNDNYIYIYIYISLRKKNKDRLIHDYESISVPYFQFLV